jgi:hypothetical protein
MIFSASELFAAVNQRDMAGDIGQVERFLDGGVAAANNGDRLVAIEETIAGGTGGDALAGEFFFGGQAEVLGRGAGRDDQGIAGVGAGIAGQGERLFASGCAV